MFPTPKHTQNSRAVLEVRGKGRGSKNATRFSHDSSAFWRSPSPGSAGTARGESMGGLMGPLRALGKSMRSRKSVDGPRNTDPSLTDEGYRWEH